MVKSIQNTNSVNCFTDVSHTSPSFFQISADLPHFPSSQISFQRHIWVLNLSLSRIHFSLHFVSSYSSRSGTLHSSSIAATECPMQYIFLIDMNKAFHLQLESGLIILPKKATIVPFRSHETGLEITVCSPEGQDTGV